MPRYQVQCDKCQKEQEIFRTLAEMDDLPKCCGVKTHRIICSTHAVPDIQPYRSMIDGTMVMGRSQHRDHLKRHNCQEIGNEVKAHLSQQTRKPVDRERRKRQIAEVLNHKI